MNGISNLNNITRLDRSGSAGSAVVGNYPLKNTLTPTKGVLSAFTRSETNYSTVVPSFDTTSQNLLKYVKANEPRFGGARRVENFAPATNGLGTAEGYYIMQNGGTAVTDGTQTAPVTGSDVVKITPTGATSQWLNKTGITRYPSITYNWSVWIKGSVNNQSASLIIYDGVSTTIQAITLTTGWARYCQTLTVAATATNIFFYIRPDTSGSNNYVYASSPMFEECTGMTNQNPSEFVSVGVGTGPTLVVNGTFAPGSDISSWTPVLSTTSIDTGRLAVTATTGGVGYAYQKINIPAGTSFRLRATITGGTSNADLRIGTSANAFDVYESSTAGTVSVDTILTAGTSTYITCRNSTTGAGFISYYGNIILESVSHGANVDGVQYFTTQNGNTVASNIVTEATGAAIPTANLYGYLAEYTRTNLCTQGSTFDNVAWTKDRSSIPGTFYASPTGRATAEKLVEDATAAATHDMYSANISVTSASVYTASIYAKQGERTKIQVVLTGTGFTSDTGYNVNLAAGTLGTAIGSPTYGQITTEANGWYKISLTAPATATNTAQLKVYLADASGNNTYNGDGTSGAYFWGAQVELGGMASSHIPTTTASASRGTDLLIYNTPNTTFLKNGSVYLEYTGRYNYNTLDPGNRARFVVPSITGSAALYFNTPSRVSSIYDGTTVGSSTSYTGYVPFVATKMASSWTLATLKMRTALVGGVGSDVAFDGSFGTDTLLQFGTGGAEGTTSFGYIRNVKLYKKSLDRATLVILTT